MRLPGDGTATWTGPTHFMTDLYAQKFELPLKDFINTGDEGFYSFYGEQPIKMKGTDKQKSLYLLLLVSS